MLGENLMTEEQALKILEMFDGWNMGQKKVYPGPLMVLGTLLMIYMMHAVNYLKKHMGY